MGRTRVLLLAQLAWAPAALDAQGQRLTVETIMRGPDFAGTAPSDVRFSAFVRSMAMRSLDILPTRRQVAFDRGLPTSR